LVEALLECLAERGAPPQTSLELPLEEYTRRVIQQLERQVSLSAQLGRRLAMLEAKLGILGRILETLETSAPTETVLSELLYRFLDATGSGQGAAYLFEPDGRLTLRAHVGYAEKHLPAVAGFFGRHDLLYEVLKRGEPAEVRVARPSAGSSADGQQTPHE